MKNNQEFTKCGDAVLLGGFDAAGKGATASKKYKVDLDIQKI